MADFYLNSHSYDYWSHIGTYNRYTNLVKSQKTFTKVGVSRPKPEIWLPPTAYQLADMEGSSVCVVGSANLHAVDRYNRTTIQTRTGVFRTGHSYPLKPTCPTYLSIGATNKCLGNLKNQKVNFSLAFAERTRSARLVESNIRRIASAVKAIKRGNVKDAANAFGVNPKKGFKHNVRNPAQLYLEMEYGWKPLLSDSFNAVDLLNAKDAEDPLRYTVSAVGKFTDHTETSVSTGNLVFPRAYFGFNGNIGYYQQDVYFYKAKCRIDAYVPNPLLGQAASLGLTNPLDVAWELVPWSFVVDWFLPIGNYLGLLDATSGLTFRGGSITTTAEHLRTIAPSSVSKISGSSWKSWNLTYDINPTQYRYFDMNRTVLSGFPSPGTYLSRNPLSGRRIYNAIALLATSILK